MPEEKTIWTGIRRGLALRCPNCGRGRLYAGYLRIRSPCEVCGTDNTMYPSDDFPPYVTILLSGHIIIPSFIVTDNAYALPFWIEGAIFLPITLILCLLMLPVTKGATVGLCWATDLTRQDAVK
ncbi:MAG TPA: DUF983 domain-containing protein [Acetobacteraceae bacterium]|jgi:uncharacterized protein (DUF983 family)|nr:DUF983 domain-containing protein [Acetobacteraceae bacterium]